MANFRGTQEPFTLNKKFEGPKWRISLVYIDFLGKVHSGVRFVESTDISIQHCVLSSLI